MTTQLEQAARQALEALEKSYKINGYPENKKAITALRAALEQPAQGCDYCNHPQYAGIKCKNCGRVTEQPKYHTYANGVRVDPVTGNVGIGTPEQPAQDEPVAYKVTGKFGDICTFCGGTNIKKGDLIYTHPQAREPLTDEQILRLVPGLQDCLCDPYDYNNSGDYYASIPKDMIRLARAIEASHGIGEKK